MEPKSGLIENEETTALTVVEHAEPLMSIMPTDEGLRVVMIVTPTLTLVDPEWVSGS